MLNTFLSSLLVFPTWLLAEVHVDVLAAARLCPADGAEGVPRAGQEVQGVWPQGTTHFFGVVWNLVLILWEPGFSSKMALEKILY
jgi:hypothetical protein